MAQNQGHNNLSNGVALAGYDLVSYFQGDAPLKGSSKYSVKVDDALYYFNNESNKNAYLKNPSAYKVVYGGWCAYAIGANAKKVEVDPLTFKIINGQLHLYYNKYFTNTLDKWNADEESLKMKADKNWLKIINL